MTALEAMTKIKDGAVVCVLKIPKAIIINLFTALFIWFRLLYIITRVLSGELPRSGAALSLIIIFFKSLYYMGFSLVTSPWKRYWSDSFQRATLEDFDCHFYKLPKYEG